MSIDTRVSPDQWAARISREYGRGRIRRFWSGMINETANLLELNPSNIGIEFHFDESDSTFPILDRETFHTGANHEIVNYQQEQIKVFEDAGLTVSLSTPNIPDGDEYAYLKNCFDALGTALYQTFQRYRESFINPKTKLPSEQGLEKFLTQWQDTAFETADDPRQVIPASLFISDLTCFGWINKRCGESRGDELLTHTGMILRKVLADTYKPGDWYLSHPHGDNFYWAVIGLPIKDPDDSNDSAQATLIKKIHHRFYEAPATVSLLDDHTPISLPLDLSIGWRPFSLRSRFENEITKANRFMQRHKQASYNRVSNLYCNLLKYNPQRDRDR